MSQEVQNMICMKTLLYSCMGIAESWPEPMMEHLVKGHSGPEGTGGSNSAA